MNPIRPLVLASALALAACDNHPPQVAKPDDAEIEQRVQQRLADERRAEVDRKSIEREQKLAQREQELAAREQELAAQRNQSAPAPLETPVASTAPEPPEPAESYQLFYDALAPMGAWIELDEYGYVWQPRVALQNPRWRPYTVGHWAYTDHGWTWISDERWGWATYHYGRWARLRRLGWVWVPDDDWAPAWVSWRYSDRYIGWAPLPPEARFDRGRGIHEQADQQFDIASDDYVFVPATEFGENDLAAVAAPPEQNVAIFSDTVNVTNIVETNSVIINNGPNIVVVNAIVRRPIARLRIERKPPSRDRENKAEVKGQTLEVVAPRLKKANAPARPAQVTERTSDTKVHRAKPAAQASPIAESAPSQPARQQAQPTQSPQQTPQVGILPRPQRVAKPSAPPAKIPSQKLPGESAVPAATPDAQGETAAQQRKLQLEAQRAERAKQLEAKRAAEKEAKVQQEQARQLLKQQQDAARSAAQQQREQRQQAGQKQSPQPQNQPQPNATLPPKQIQIPVQPNAPPQTVNPERGKQRRNAPATATPQPSGTPIP